jgi:hypothetical protein
MIRSSAWCVRTLSKDGRPGSTREWPKTLALALLWLVPALVAGPCPAFAQPAPPDSDEAGEPEPSTAEPPAPPKPLLYSNGWQLRPLLAPTGLRSDTVVGFYEDAQSRGGRTLVSFLTAAARVPGTGPDRLGLDLVLRAGYVHDSPPTGKAGAAFTNVLVGAAYAMRLPREFLLNLFLATTLPVGTGSGNDAAKEDVAARQRGASARSGFDVAMATNDVGVVPGVGVGWVSQGLTLQFEATLAQLLRVRGGAVQPEATRTNSVLAFHAGYFFLPFLSAGAEIRYNRWLDPPSAVRADKTGASYDNLSVALGPRLHVRLASGWLRPGVAYVRALDKPLAAAVPNLQIVQLDIPYTF